MLAGTATSLVSLTPLQAGGGELASWEIALIAFAFVAWILVVGALLERWEVRLHA